MEKLVREVLAVLRQRSLGAEMRLYYMSDAFGCGLDVLSNLAAFHQICYYAIRAPNATVARILFDIQQCIELEDWAMIEQFLNFEVSNNDSPPMTASEWIEIYEEDEDHCETMMTNGVFTDDVRKGGKIFAIDNIERLLDRWFRKKK
jgi:hypothetical protein